MPSGRKSTTGVKYINRLSNGKYRVQGRDNGIRVQGGMYDTLEEAIAALEDLRAEIRGDFSNSHTSKQPYMTADELRRRRRNGASIEVLAELNDCYTREIRRRMEA